jgi:hypothetical protein
MALLNATRAWTDEAKRLETPAGLNGSHFFTIAVRSVVIEQRESLEFIVLLSEAERGYAALALLRSMCEELVWVKFLAVLTREDAERAISALAQIDLFDAYTAQENYAVSNLPFDPAWIAKAQNAADRGKQALRSIFLSKGFQLRPRAHRPSFAQLAKSVGMEGEYKFIYHGTSKAVHFNVHELLRRAWGTRAEMTISSVPMKPYWSMAGTRPNATP